MLRGQAEVTQNLDRWYQGRLAKAREAMEEIAVILEGYAKSHHPWTPRTGHTDVSTRGFIAEATPKIITAVLTAGMAYNVFLELCHEGRWSWLWPAVEENLPLIRQKLEGIVR